MKKIRVVEKKIVVSLHSQFSGSIESEDCFHFLTAVSDSPKQFMKKEGPAAMLFTSKLCATDEIISSCLWPNNIGLICDWANVKLTLLLKLFGCIQSAAWGFDDVFMLLFFAIQAQLFDKHLVVHL